MFISVGNGDDAVETPMVVAATNKVIAAAREFKPHIVMASVNRIQAELDAISGIERQWPDPAPRPQFILANPATDAVVGIVFQTPGGPPAWATVRTRVFMQRYRAKALDAARDELFRTAMQRFNPQLANPSMAALEGGPYMSLYAIALAIAAAGPSEITGSVIAQNLSRLIGGGTPIDGNEQQLVQGFEALKTGSIQLNFAVGPFSLDAERKFNWGKFVGLCVSPANQPKEMTYSYEPGGTSTGPGTWICD